MSSCDRVYLIELDQGTVIVEESLDWTAAPS
jgi:hypothetical protein